MKIKNNFSLNLLFFSLFITSFFYSLFSYSLTDPNLVITTWQPYWNFQQWMWQTFFHNPVLLTITFSIFIAVFFAIYFYSFNKLKKQNKYSSKDLFIKIFFSLSPLFFSYNALSHDVFNYMFNAKMVTLFHVNPHIKVALDFSFDNWTRFMHNTHTPAPYGYGWTIFSLIPSLLGFNKFIITWFIFKVISWISYILLFLGLQKLSQKLNNKNLSSEHTWLIFANPLIFIEILSNLHNDLWMLVPAIAALALIIKKPKKRIFWTAFLSLLLLSFSISTKLATIVVIPFWLHWISQWFIKINLTKSKKLFSKEKIKEIFPLLISIALFLPLLTLRSQQFLPWYLSWSFIWLPFITFLPWKNLLIAFSLSSLLRYIPWLLTGGFEGAVLPQQKLITWIGGLSIFIILTTISFLKNKKLVKIS